MDALPTSPGNRTLVSWCGLVPFCRTDKQNSKFPVVHSLMMTRTRDWHASSKYEINSTYDKIGNFVLLTENYYCSTAVTFVKTPFFLWLLSCWLWSRNRPNSCWFVCCCNSASVVCQKPQNEIVLDSVNSMEMGTRSSFQKLLPALPSEQNILNFLTWLNDCNACGDVMSAFPQNSQMLQCLPSSCKWCDSWPDRLGCPKSPHFIWDHCHTLNTKKSLSEKRHGRSATKVIPNPRLGDRIGLVFEKTRLSAVPQMKKARFIRVNDKTK